MKNKEINVLLSAPRGFCAGVERAIEIVEKSIQKYGAPVYVRHEIVHNKFVVDDLKKKGAIFVEELEEINDKSRPVIFSAHGVPKKIPEDAKNYNMTYVDATCPLVSKVHREAENLNKAGYHIILIGHKNHPEVIGTMGQLPEGSIDLVQNEEEAKNYENKDPKEVVIDEFIGQSIPIYLYEVAHGTIKNSQEAALLYLYIFILFRYFDIKKPFPVNYFDKKFKNSFGVILDDVVAGLYVVLTLIIFMIIKSKFF